MPECATNSPRLVWRRVGDLVWKVRQPANRLVEAIVQEPEAFLRDPALFFKNSRVVTLSRVPSLEPKAPSLILRRLNYGKWRHQLRDVFRASRAERALSNGLLLESHGISTPRSWAAATRRSYRWPLRAYLITEEVPGAVSLRAFAEEKSWLPAAIVSKLAQLLAQLHNAGFSHRDLKTTNILMDGSGDLWLIDLDGIRVLGKISRERVVLDLSRLAADFVAKPGLLRRSGGRFLVEYARHRHPAANARELGERIMARTVL